MRTIKSLIYKLINLTPLTKEVSVRLYRFLMKCKYRIMQRRFPTDDKMIVFESFLGKQFGCSPKALFLSMVNNPEYDAYQKIWMFKNPDAYKELEQYPNTKVVSYGSTEYYEYYARAKYWITNYHLPAGVVKKKDQVYVQTWHGTPLKKIGCDVGNPKNLSQDKKRAWRDYRDEGKIIDFMPSPSPFYTEKIKSAFLLQEQAQVLEYGYPRNDFLFSYEDGVVGKMKEHLNIPKNKKVILYAPTWRDNQHIPGQGYVYQCGVDFDLLKQELQDEYVILFRAHYLISNSFDFDNYKGFIVDVSHYDDINELYVISDILVVDYSSVFFDYANLKRPIIFYMYDYEEYKNEMRDFYFSVDELPGPIVKEEKALVHAIRDAMKEEFCPDEKYIAFNQKYNPYPVCCSEKVTAKILGQG